MEHIIGVTIRNKVAMCSGARYICGNSDYGIRFEFDEEWDKFDVKTARFRWKSQYIDVVFSGTDCPVPIIIDVDLFSVGVYAGNLRTTTPAYIGADRSILCGTFTPEDPSPDVYSQIMDKLNELAEDVQELSENPGQGGAPGVQFTTDETLSLENGVLSVNRADQPEPDNTLPITAAAVYASVGNIETLLGTI